MELNLKPQPLSREAFAPFGDVIDTEGNPSFPINGGNATRFHDMAELDVSAQGGCPLLSIFRAQPLNYPLKINMMERHPLASQAFVPRGRQSFLLVVAPPGDNPTPDQLRAFIATDGQGVNYHAGVWHFPVLALEPNQDFIIIDRGGEGENCDEFYFSDDQQILLHYP